MPHIASQIAPPTAAAAATHPGPMRAASRLAPQCLLLLNSYPMCHQRLTGAPASSPHLARALSQSPPPAEMVLQSRVLGPANSRRLCPLNRVNPHTQPILHPPSQQHTRLNNATPIMIIVPYMQLLDYFRICFALFHCILNLFRFFCFLFALLCSGQMCRSPGSGASLGVPWASFY